MWLPDREFFIHTKRDKKRQSDTRPLKPRDMCACIFSHGKEGEEEGEEEVEEGVFGFGLSEVERKGELN